MSIISFLTFEPLLIFANRKNGLFHLHIVRDNQINPGAIGIEQEQII